MKSLIYALFMACMAETIPNPHIVSNLTSEQQHLIRKYADRKCSQQVIEYLNLQDENSMCRLPESPCM